MFLFILFFINYLILGPYILIWGSVATILSKEMYVYWVDTLEHIVFLGVIIGASKILGPKISKYLDSEVEKNEQELKNSFNVGLKGILLFNIKLRVHRRFKVFLFLPLYSNRSAISRTCTASGFD